MFSHTVCCLLITVAAITEACVPDLFGSGTTARPPVTTVGPNSDVGQVFQSSGLVPDVVSSPPTHWLTVSYQGVTVVAGSRLTLAQTDRRPTLSVAGGVCDPQAYYTVVMTDPDVPSRESPVLGEARYWLRINVQGCTGLGNEGAGQEVSPYVGPGPDQGTQLHRYVLLLFKQTSLIQPFTGEELTNPSNRINWKVQNFARRYGMELVAGTYFLAEYNLALDLVAAEVEKDVVDL